MGQSLWPRVLSGADEGASVPAGVLLSEVSGSHTRSSWSTSPKQPGSWPQVPTTHNLQASRRLVDK